MPDLKGKVVLVTGAAQGLGACFANALAAEGASVAIGDLDDLGATSGAITSHGSACFARKLDVSDRASVTSFVQATAATLGNIDILVNNAAVSGKLQLRQFDEIESSQWDRVMAVNVRGAFECARAVVPAMKRRKQGRIINLASGTAIKGSPGLLHYVASKGAVISMTRALARELGDFGINVNCIAPGLTMSENMINHPSWTVDIVRRNIESRALKREAVPDDIVGALLFLSSPASAFMTGQTLSVDGGSVMN
ncbi:MAG: SDR family oxidoreductase [Proteobacteria bacterium]|nr:SDR family oxidoreductase [Pseudomonadota bacterium]